MAYSEQENANLDLVQRVYDTVLQPLDSANVDGLFSPDYIQHNPDAETGAAGLKTFLDWARQASPDAQHHVKRMFADGEFVIAHVHVVINPGDRGNNVIDIFRIGGGRIVEHWDAAQQIPEKIMHENGIF